jgi:protein phosphatase
LSKLTTYARSDVGLVRTNNEDSYFADDERGLVVVADGMGGHAAGEVASRIAVETIVGEIAPVNSFWPFGRAQRERNLVVEAIRSANERVREAASRDSALTGMGTTVVVLWICARRAHVAHVGDSRIYRFQQNALVQLTRDHSWPSEMSAMRNVLTRAVGAEALVEVDHRLVEVRPGDIFLLCSDGLTRTVDDASIIRTLSENPNGGIASERLIELAKQKGAPDNVTVALVYC